MALLSTPLFWENHPGASRATTLLPLRRSRFSRPPLCTRIVASAAALLPAPLAKDPETVSVEAVAELLTVTAGSGKLSGNPGGGVVGIAMLPPASTVSD
jgi:hypothetical protein